MADNWYVGLSKLQDKIKQHVSKSICSGSSFQKRILSACWCKSSTQSLLSDSVIGLYLLQIFTGVQHFNNSQFSVLAQDRSLFHQSDLEATFIETFYPALCLQKDFVHNLKIVNINAFPLVFFRPIAARLFFWE